MTQHHNYKIKFVDIFRKAQEMSEFKTKYFFQNVQDSQKTILKSKSYIIVITRSSVLTSSKKRKK